jgi:serpin B
MKDALKTLGVINAFESDKANLKRLGVNKKGNLYIGSLLTKTYISVDERGTKAGAVAVTRVVSPTSGTLVIPKTVRLDRPFIYAIIDNATYLPLFIGTVMSVL